MEEIHDKFVHPNFSTIGVKCDKITSDKCSSNYFLHRSLERCNESDVVVKIFQDFCRMKFTKILKNLVGLTNPIPPPYSYDLCKWIDIILFV